MLALAVCLPAACDDAPDYSKKYAVRKQVDSLFRAHIKAVTTEMDTRCSLRRERVLDKMVDSILVERHSESFEIRRRAQPSPE